jgi:hypothetical protein
VLKEKKTLSWSNTLRMEKPRGHRRRVERSFYLSQVLAKHQLSQEVTEREMPDNVG